MNKVIVGPPVLQHRPAYQEQHSGRRHLRLTLARAKEIKENFLKPVNQYKEYSSSREWTSDDRKYFQTITWMDVGQNIPNLSRTEHPEELFSSYEEADAYAESLGGYCDDLHKIGKKRYGFF